jgi:hypothetical protein
MIVNCYGQGALVMKNLHLVLILPCILFSLPTLAQEPAIQPQTQGEVTFVSGGVGIQELAELQAMRADYNLSLLFSERNGDYLSDVKVRITDTRGNTFLETVSNGPKLFVKLPSGRYTVIAELDGKRFDKTVTVSTNNHQPAVSFVWP